MKKFIYLFMILGLITACDPMEDIHNDIDAQVEVITGEVEYTLTDDDYDDLDLSFGNFSSIDDAKAMIPGLLTDMYPVWGEGSLAAVTFNLFSPIKFDSYTVTDADYTAIDLTSLNHSGDFNDFFNHGFPSEAKGTVIDLTYKTEPTITDYTLTDDDYASVGNGRFDNFDIRTGKAEETIDARRFKIQTILLNNFPDAPDGSKYNVTYDAFNNDFQNVTLEMLVKQQQNAPDASLTTEYTLTDADFDLVGNGNFDNFDIRQGKDEETIEARRAKIETILLNNFTATVGDLYNVTYAVWEGFNSTRVMLVEFDGTGYTIFSTTSYELYTFTLEDATTRFTLSDEWAAPVTFTADEYTLMGQRFPNFSDRDEAVYKIGIYLRTLYQFAAPDDFVAVEYNYFSSGSVSQRNVNYVFDGSVWNAIPTVIEETVKFGHDGNSWVPDNTINYTLIAADYTLVGNGRFGNFDVRAGKDEETVESRRVKINTILLNNFPGMAEGQKYVVTYNVWSGAPEIFQMKVILVGGEYMLNE